MAETEILDITKEAASTNGHMRFDDDMAFLKHITSKKPAEELIDVPEWSVQILCKALTAESRIEIQIAGYDDKQKRTDYRRVFHMIVMAGCYNPTTGHRIFTASHKDVIMRELDGAVVERLALAILRLSGMLASDAERTKKN